MEKAMHTTIDLAEFRQQIAVQKQKSTYAQLEKEYGVNRFYLWNIIKDESYQPPAHICDDLGILHYQPVPVCPTHKIAHCFDCSTQIVREKTECKPRIYKSLSDWPVYLLRAAIENREVVRE